MLISVVYQNNEIGLVEDHQLDELISSKKIKKFLRSEGWVTIGVDLTRKAARIDFEWPEKRRRIDKTFKVGANH
jgi:hypothetical protein